MKKVIFSFGVLAVALVLNAKDLVWIGDSGSVWNEAAAVWRDGESVVAWEDGATAVFAAAGLVSVEGSLKVGGIRFESSGTALVGPGRIDLSGAIDAAAGTENSISTKLYAAPTMSKTGPGTVAVAYTRGNFAIQTGTVLAGGYNMLNTAVTIADGAELKSVAGGRAEESLLVNGSFEEPAFKGYRYVSDSNMPPGWKRESSNYVVHMDETAHQSTWNSALSNVPDGKMILGVQLNGALSQTVTVPTDGYYDFSFFMFRRGNYRPHQLYFFMDGLFWQSFYADLYSGVPRRIDSGAVYLKAGSHKILIRGEGFWGDTATFIDACTFAAPTLTTATSIPVSPGIVVDVPDGEQTLAETYTLSTDETKFQRFTKSGAGKAIFANDLVTSAWSIYDVEGEAEYLGTLQANDELHKRGSGVLTLDHSWSKGTFFIENGSLRVKSFTGSMSVSYRVERGATAGFYPGLASGDATLSALAFQGDGICTIGTIGDGHALTISNGATLNVPEARMDVGVGDTIKMGDLRAELVGNNRDYVDTDVVKMGPGTLELMKNPSCYAPTHFIVREGVLRTDVTDEKISLAYKNASNVEIKGTTYGLMRGETTPLLLGDRNSPSDGSVVFSVNSAAFKSSRSLMVNPQPASVTIQIEKGTAQLAGGLALNRANVNLAGAVGATLVLGPITKEAGVSPRLTLDTNLSLSLDGAIDAGVSLDAPHAAGLNFKSGAATATTLSTARLGGAMTVDFDDRGVCDCLTAETLSLGTLALTLNDLARGGAFVLSGRYVIARYATLEGSLDGLSVANAQDGRTYAFSATDGEIVLTIGSTEASPLYVWMGASGDWADAANWDHATTPNGPGVQIVVPRTSQVKNELTLGSAVTLGSLSFEGASGGSLAGGALNFSPAEGAEIRVMKGDVTISSRIDGERVRVVVAKGASLAINGVVTAELELVEGSDVTFGSAADVKGAIVIEKAGVLTTANNVTLTDAGLKGLYGKFWKLSSFSTADIDKIADWRVFKAWVESGTLLAHQLMDNPAGFAVDDKTLNNLPEIVAKSDAWAGVWEGTLTVPTSGAYGFKAACDDDYLLAIDGVNVVQTKSNGAASTTVNLAAGPHRIFLGLLDHQGNSLLDVTVRTPDGTTQRLPLAWLTPDLTVDSFLGRATIQPNDGSALGLCQAKGLTTADLTQKGPGALVAFGAGEIESTVSGGSVMAVDQVQFVGRAPVTAATVGVVEGASVVLPSGGTVKSLVGSGTLSAGGAYAFAVTGDADCGISSRKTYTHLINWTTAAYNEPVNGVRFDLSTDYPQSKAQGIVGVLAEGGNPGVQPQPSDTTPYRQMMRKLGLGNALTNTLTIKGLTPGKMYDFRFYLRPFGRTDRKFTHNFLVDGKVVGSVVWDANSSAGRVATGDDRLIDPMSVVGCRYRAGNNGTLVLKTAKYNLADKNGFHYYAVSNEELPDGSGALTLAPEGESVFSGTIVAPGEVTVAGTAPQVFRGTVAADLTVSGSVILDGARAMGATTVAADGSLELRAGARVGGLTGSGSVTLVHADAGDACGRVQADGAFAAATYPRRVFFTGDADCGFSSGKRYAHAWNFGATDETWPTMINGVELAGFYRKNVIADGRRFVTLSLPGGGEKSGEEPSWSAEFKASEVYALLKGMSYSGASGEFNFNGLKAGRSYEIRMYNRRWGSNPRQCIYTCDPLGNGQTVTFDFNEDDAVNPSYVAFRVTATGTNFVLRSTTKQSKDNPHFYGATVEEVADYTRVLATDSDATFVGSISGAADFRKEGAGVQTLAGIVKADGLWTVAEGALLLANAASSVSNVTVRAGAAFGGEATVTGDLGVQAGGRLVLSGGVLDVKGQVVLAEGGKLSVVCDETGSGTLNAATPSLPTTLAIDLSLADGAKGVAREMTLLTGNLEGVNVSGWTVSGSFPGARRITLRQVGNKVMALRPGLVLFLK